MKIYFAGSIRAGREDWEIYQELIEKMGRFGEVLTEHVGDRDLPDSGENVLPDEEIFRRDMAWLEEANVVVAEVTTPSLGVGFEIGRAELLEKPVLCLHRQKEGRRLSAMIAGNPNLRVEDYERVDQAVDLIADFLGESP